MLSFNAKFLLLMLGFVFGVAFPAKAQVNLGGVRFEPEAQVAGQKLQLNGAGVRIKAIFRVYAAALYTPATLKKSEDVLRINAPRRMHLVALRDVKGDEFGRLFARAMEDNSSKEEFAKVIANVVRMGQIFSDAKSFYKNDVILLDFIPGTGVIVTYRGKQLGEAFKEPEFMNLLLKTWFGAKPVDNELRKALLGEQSTANTNIF